MIDVFIENGDNHLHTRFPIKMNELTTQIEGIGIKQSASKISAHGSEELRVTMGALNEMGEAVLSRVSADDSLGAVNFVCLAVARVCVYGNREFLDMLAPKPGGEYEFYRKFDHRGSSRKTGIAGLLEETMRYTAMTAEYARAHGKTGKKL